MLEAWPCFAIVAVHFSIRGKRISESTAPCLRTLCAAQHCHWGFETAGLKQMRGVVFYAPHSLCLHDNTVRRAACKRLQECFSPETFGQFAAVAFHRSHMCFPLRHGLSRLNLTVYPDAGLMRLAGAKFIQDGAENCSVDRNGGLPHSLFRFDDCK